MKLNAEQIEILVETGIRLRSGLYQGSGPDIQELVKLGLMVFAGRTSFEDDPYYRLTYEGARRVTEFDF